MSDDARFDPRFDPAFQPGYDGPVVAAPAVVKEPPVKTTPAANAAGIVEEPEELEPPRRPLELQLEPDAPARRANPFLIALAAVALALTVGGLYLVSRVRDLFAATQSSSALDYTTMQVVIIGAPLLVCLGIATGVGLLFIFATRWGKP